jgi:hypothetical protein
MIKNLVMRKPFRAIIKNNQAIFKNQLIFFLQDGTIYSKYIRLKIRSTACGI